MSTILIFSWTVSGHLSLSLTSPLLRHGEKMTGCWQCYEFVCVSYPGSWPQQTLCCTPRASRATSGSLYLYHASSGPWDAAAATTPTPAPDLHTHTRTQDKETATVNTAFRKALKNLINTGSYDMSASLSSFTFTTPSGPRQSLKGLYFILKPL